MCCADESPKPIVILKRPRKFVNARAVLQFQTRSGKTWRVRLLDIEKTPRQQMRYNDHGRVDGVSSKQITLYLSPCDFTLTRDTALPRRRLTCINTRDDFISHQVNILARHDKQNQNSPSRDLEEGVQK